MQMIYSLVLQHQLPGGHFAAHLTAAGIAHQCTAHINAENVAASTAAGIVLTEAGAAYPQVSPVA